jgi:hypothetical protein
VLPSTHVPPVAAEQHPVLHGVLALQESVQVCDVVLHACSGGQSFAVSHPHESPPVPTMH